MLHDFVNAYRGLVDSAAVLCAGVAVISLQQAAWVATILACAMTLILGTIRVYDRVRYGPGRGRE